MIDLPAEGTEAELMVYNSLMHDAEREHCGEFWDETEDHEHTCDLDEAHDEDHECDCGATW